VGEEVVSEDNVADVPDDRHRLAVVDRRVATRLEDGVGTVFTQVNGEGAVGAGPDDEVPHHWLGLVGQDHAHEQRELSWSTVRLGGGKAVDVAASGDVLLRRG